MVFPANAAYDGSVVLCPDMTPSDGTIRLVPFRLARRRFRSGRRRAVPFRRADGKLQSLTPSGSLSAESGSRVAPPRFRKQPDDKVQSLTPWTQSDPLDAVVGGFARADAVPSRSGERTANCKA